MKRDVNINKFLVLSFFIVFFVSLDILIQFILGKNILGFKAQNIDEYSIYYTGFFKEELIAGGFIMMFSTLSFFSIPLFFKNQSKISLLIIFVSIAFKRFTISHICPIAVKCEDSLYKPLFLCNFLSKVFFPHKSNFSYLFQSP